MYDQYNEAIQRVGKQMAETVKKTGRGMGIVHRPNSPSPTESLARIKDRYGYDSAGVINRVTIGNINRSLIYASMGAGKGKAGRKGSRWLNRKGEKKDTNPESLGKMATGSRKSKPFIDQTLQGPEGIELLADTVASFQADAIIESITLK